MYQHSGQQEQQIDEQVVEAIIWNNTAKFCRKFITLPSAKLNLKTGTGTIQLPLPDIVILNEKSENWLEAQSMLHKNKHESRAEGSGRLPICQGYVSLHWLG